MAECLRVDAGARGPRVRSWFCNLLALCLGQFAYFSVLGFFSCQKGIMIALTRKTLAQCSAHSQSSLGVGCYCCHYYYQHYFHHYYYLSVVLNYVPVLSLKPVVTSLKPLSQSHLLLIRVVIQVKLAPWCYCTHLCLCLRISLTRHAFPSNLYVELSDIPTFSDPARPPLAFHSTSPLIH